MKILVHFHLYYYEQLDFFLEKLKNIQNCEWDLYITYVEENQDMKNKILKFKPDAKFVKVNNVGYDIWPFIQVLRMLDLNKYDYILKLHTKNFYIKPVNLIRYKYNKCNTKGYFWRDRLVNALLGSKRVFAKNLSFMKKGNVGLIADKSFYLPILDVNLPEETYQLDELKRRLMVETKCNEFVAGTMFIIKTDVLNLIVNSDISENDFSEISESHTKGTIAHTIERIFAMLVIMNNYDIVLKTDIDLKIKNFIKLIIQKIFFLGNSYDKSHKIITIFGINLKIKKKPKLKDKLAYYEYIETYQNQSKDNFVPITENVYNNSNSVKPIAFYLPQFHSIPLNDENFGKGFTEWTNVTKAIPQFVGHYQPHLPIDVGYYDLSKDDVMYRQIELAKMYGIYGFCFHYYWFSGKRLLEKPIFNWLNNKELNLPFCLCWANENWSKLWDGGNREIIMEQKLEENDDEKFFYDILPFFKDDRYIKIDNKPFLIIYRLNLFETDRINHFIKIIRELAKKEGFGGVHIVAAESFGFNNQDDKYDIDCSVEFPPHNFSHLENYYPKYVNSEFIGKIRDMSEYIKTKPYIYDENNHKYKAVFAGWDNTARKAKSNATVFLCDPKLYKEWLSDVVNWTKKHHSESDRFVFINAWNEWGEGAHLEPDQKFGYAYLQATKDVLEEK